MGRWEPDARGRMVLAALDLYADLGYEQTTVQDIAARAGVTERTFFRHFADKREVLFVGSQDLVDAVVAGVDAQPDGLDPLDVAGRAMVAAAAVLQDRHDFARTRSRVVAANSSLLERELLKLDTLTAALAETLRARGVPPQAARLAAGAGVTVFHQGFAAWVADDAPDADLARCIASALDELRGLVQG
jgi:AcrR family transcriptional regulator